MPQKGQHKPLQLQSRLVVVMGSMGVVEACSLKCVAGSENKKFKIGLRYHKKGMVTQVTLEPLLGIRNNKGG